MGKKGLSFEQKRTRMLEIFLTHKEVFHLKELEKLGPKKGIIPQSIKDVLKSLVDDSLVEFDKIGAGVYYWSFPSKAYQLRKNCLEINKKELKELEKQNEELQAKVNALKAVKEEENGKDSQTERTDLVKQLKDLKQDQETIREELTKFEKNDPQRLEQLEQEEKKCKSNANQWIDNLYQIQSFLKKQRPDIKTQDWEKQFPIFKDLEYFE